MIDIKSSFNVWMWVDLESLDGGATERARIMKCTMALCCCRRMVISPYLVWAAVTRDDTERENACLVGESQIRHWLIYANMLIYQWQKRAMAQDH